MTETTYLIVTDRPWYQTLPERLQARLPGRFFLIDRPQDLTANQLATLRPGFVFIPHWSSRIPAEIHQHHECVIFHMTDLPYGRGGSPLQNLIVRGHTETVISALRCEESLDTGPVYMKQPLELHGTAEDIFLRAARIIEQMIVDIIKHKPAPQPQQGEPVTFRRRRPEDGDLQQANSLRQWYDFIRMLDAPGYPRAFLRVGPFRLEFDNAIANDDDVQASVTISRIDEKNHE